MKRLFSIVFLFSGCAGLFAQGAFESAINEKPATGLSGLAISGYSRATGYLGILRNESPTIKSLYNETSLRLKAKTGNWGQAYTDIRFRLGNEYGTEFSSLTVREAYLDLFAGKFELRIGKQISPWGRADGWNPTDNLTPSDYFIRSPDHDDMRIGSYRVRGQFNPAEWLKLEADWVPFYTPSSYRFDLVGMPSFVKIADPLNPEFIWNKTTGAFKMDFIFPAVEGSLSYFNGYDPLPALKPGILPTPPFNDLSLELVQIPFRQQTFGADFATIILSAGFRGEIAWKIPQQGDSADPFIPNSEIQWVMSLDREFGPFRIIAGYMGKHVNDFTPADPPQTIDPAMISNPEIWPLLGSLLASQIGYYNRILYDQTHEWNHTLLLRPSVSAFNENLDLEVSGLYNLTTGEYLIYPKISYRLTDGLQASAGYQYYDGNEYTRFSWIKQAFNGPFFEFRLTF